MAKCATFLSWFMLVALVIFHETAEAVPGDEDLDRVTYAYNFRTDPCYKLTDTSDPATKAAADEGCAMAFDALDRTGANTCQGYHNPECRRFRGYPHYLCSCAITTYDALGTKKTDEYTFRKCAGMMAGAVTWRAAQAPVPTVNFPREQAIARQNSARKNTSGEGTSREGTSRPPKEGPSRPAGEGPSRPAFVPSAVTDRKRFRSVGNRRGARAALGAGSAWGVGSAWDARSGLDAPPSRDAGTSSAAGRRGRSPARNEGASSSTAAEPSTRQRTMSEHTCDVCDAEFSSGERLDGHSRVHRGGTFCEHCGKTFPNKAALQAHYKPCKEEHTPQPEFGEHSKDGSYSMW